MKVKELLLTGLLVLLCAMPNVAMAADTTVTRSYPFESATQENPHYTVPETVEEGGKTYRGALRQRSGDQDILLRPGWKRGSPEDQHHHRQQDGQHLHQPAGGLRHPSQHMEKSGGTVGGHTPHRLPETQKEFLFQGVTISYPSTKRRLLPSLFYLTWKGVSL